MSPSTRRELFTLEQLVGGDRVGQIASRGQPPGDAEAAAADVSGERLVGVPSVSEIPAAVDDLPFAGEQGTKHGDVVGRLVLEIGVLDDQVIAGRARDSGADRLPFAAVLRHPP